MNSCVERTISLTSRLGLNAPERSFEIARYRCNWLTARHCESVGQISATALGRASKRRNWLLEITKPNVKPDESLHEGNSAVYPFERTCLKIRQFLAIVLCRHYFRNAVTPQNLANYVLSGALLH